MLGVLRRMFNANDREIRRLTDLAQEVAAFEPEMQALSDGDLQGKTVAFRERLGNGQPLDEILPEAFAVVREASRRVLGQRPYDVQIMGAAVLHEGRVAEMKTGEGKTLVATLPTYLNALPGEGVHIVTVNDYLAKRDSEWMGQIHRFLGLSVGLIVHGLDAPTRQRAYHADITYGTNNEFGFDYLRDNMVIYAQELVQRPLNYAIVDEVDSILIDEARTPLIISGMSDKPTELYYKFARLVENLKDEEDYTFDEKLHTVAPTEEGVEKVERALGVDSLFSPENMDLTHYLENALKAKALMHLDRDYIIKDGEVIIVDEFTGRLMFGRRYSDGLHQAIEAKEDVKIAQDSQTLATITFQNYFRLYKKLAGMTGTAATEEEELQKIYKLDVVVMPTNLPMVRQDLADVIYKSEAAKYRAVVEDIRACYEKGQPVLVGTVSVDKSERLSRQLERTGIRHQVLNAKYHEKEAEIIAQAGRRGAVTIATNMAGRGTDIMLGGNPEYLAKERLRQEGTDPDVITLVSESGPIPEELEAVRARYHALIREFRKQTNAEHEEVVQAGGLHIIGTERHESRRIDNQLRGRSGRQGDPGSSRFYLALDDDLMRLFGSENIRGVLDRLGVEEDEPIEHPLISRAIETAQRKVESRNFDTRKRVLDYDDVMNQQREVIYRQRREVLAHEDLRPAIAEMVDKVIGTIVDDHCPSDGDPEAWDLAGLHETALATFGAAPEQAELQGAGKEAVAAAVAEAAQAAYAHKEATIGSPTMRELERVILLRIVDQKWIEHLDNMDDLREGIGLRGYGQQDPLVQYKIEAYDMFNEMIEHVQEDAVKVLFRIEIVRQPAQAQAPAEPAELLQRRQVARGAVASHASMPAAAAPAVAAAGGGGITRMAASRPASVPGGAEAQAGAPPKPQPVRVAKVGRNDPCPCGSGKKYKHCHGK
ncbi:MAG TPA: preprotein translocase subunit SecA [Bacillota bacterium]|nr:preprotein translocase subunit SecA [Bacillota bacterium]